MIIGMPIILNLMAYVCCTREEKSAELFKISENHGLLNDLITEMYLLKYVQFLVQGKSLACPYQVHRIQDNT